MEGGIRPVRAIADRAAQTNRRRSAVAATDTALRGNRNPSMVRVGAGIPAVSTETDRHASLRRLGAPGSQMGIHNAKRLGINRRAKKKPPDVCRAGAV